jgi:hypothetical protein
LDEEARQQLPFRTSDLRKEVEGCAWQEMMRSNASRQDHSHERIGKNTIEALHENRIDKVSDDRGGNERHLPSPALFGQHGILRRTLEEHRIGVYAYQQEHDR